MNHERTGASKNKKQNNTNTSKPNSSSAYCREFAEDLRRSTRSDEKTGWLRQGTRGIQGNYESRFWEDGWN